MSPYYSIKRILKHRSSRFILFWLISFASLNIVLFLSAGNVYSGQATLSWDPPTTNADGTPLTDLDGYNVYYGTVSGNYSQNIDVGYVTTYTVPNLTDGLTYYFAVTAYDIAMNESEYSNEASKTIQTQPVQPTLAINKTGTGSGIVEAPGINCGSDCTEQYNQGTVVTLTSTPSTGSTFAGWSGGGCTGIGTCSISINSNTTVTATFNIVSYTITATAGTGGSISPSGTVPVNHGANRAFTITPNSGYKIANVLVDGTSFGAISTYTFSNVTANHTISASFTTNTHNLTVTKGGTGSGTVISSPAGISCGSDCGEVYDAGTVVTLSASPDASSTFAGWSGVCTGTGTCSVTMDAAKLVTATFTMRTYSLSITKTGSGRGTVTSSPAGISCGSDCGEVYDAGTVVTLSASPDASSTFAGWSGVCTGTGTCSVTMDAAKSVTATFTMRTYTITATAGIGGSISPYGIVSVNHGASQAFTITADLNNSVSDVLVDGSSIGSVLTYTFTNVTSDHAISVFFTNLDSDNDGILDIEEQGPESNNTNYDGNNDEIPDYLQSSVASFHTFDRAKYITLSSQDEYSLSNVAAIQEPQEKPLEASFPYNFIEFRVENLPQGASTNIIMKLPEGSSINSYYKYGPTLEDPTPHWYNFLFDGQTGAKISDNIITLYFIDGLRGDDDLTVNGQILDQGGPVIVSEITVTPSSYNFGVVNVETTTPAQIFTLSYIGIANLNIGTVTIEGADAENFIIDDDMCSSQIITPSGTCTISTVFSPLSAGNKSAILKIPCDDSETPVVNIPLSGTGEIQQYILSINKTGDGTVTSNPLGINCGNSCSHPFDKETTITLTATPVSDSTFAGWSGGGCTGTGTCSINVNANTTVTATFNKQTDITVTSPSGGETWVAGSTGMISWTYKGNPGSYVVIELLQGEGNTVVRTITSGARTSTGYYSWRIPSNQTLGTDYRIRVKSKSYSNVYSTSDYFTIEGPPPPEISVTSPIGGETWVAGSTGMISWTYKGNPGSYVVIELLQGEGNTVVRTITSRGRTSTGYYSWRIPSYQTLGTDYRIRVKSKSYSNVYSTSDYFTIE